MHVRLARVEPGLPIKLKADFETNRCTTHTESIPGINTRFCNERVANGLTSLAVCVLNLSHGGQVWAWSHWRDLAYMFRMRNMQLINGIGICT